MPTHETTSAYSTLLELVDAHQAEDRLTVVECFRSLAAHGASGKVSGLRANLHQNHPEVSMTILEVFAQFAKSVSNEDEQLAVIHALQVL